jgi:hypothetical protein
MQIVYLDWFKEFSIECGRRLIMVSKGKLSSNWHQSVEFSKNVQFMQNQ